ncbi:MAG TPA: formate/nitrite transporter family protein, partial [Candidatus Cloacimonadota bacterium]|nr:formate/nitrite transporter family protein [Candidatus Cloacimonadota bacterium]
GLVSGVIADKAIAIAAGKTGASFWQIFVRGIMCNWLVCLAVWLALAAHDIPGKILGIFMPIMAFVASGFEHSVANMYFIPMGMMLDSNITQNGLWGNLAASTLGNIVGGAFFVATLYWFVYHKCNKK